MRQNRFYNFSHPQPVFLCNEQTEGGVRLTEYIINVTLLRRRSSSYRNQSIDLLRKSVDWFLYDNSLRQERVKRSS